MGWGWGGTAGGASPSDQQDGPGRGGRGALSSDQSTGARGAARLRVPFPEPAAVTASAQESPSPSGLPGVPAPSSRRFPRPRLCPASSGPVWGGARAAPGTLLLPLPRPIASGETLRRAPRRNPPLPAVSRHSAWGTADVTATGRAKASQSQIAGTESKQNKKKRKERKKRCSKGARGNADAPGERQPQ